MKKNIIFLISIMIFLSCTSNDNSSDNEQYKSEGIITGYDLRECACCGGFFIIIEDSTFRFDTIPAKSELKLENPVFPINVLLDWKKSENPCMGDEIIIEKIKKK